MREMQNIPSNLELLHVEEERIRAASLQLVQGDKLLSEHLNAIYDALDIYDCLRREDSATGSAAFAIQLLGLRAFNIGASVIKLGLSGYYQVAFHLMRDLLELINLIDLFTENPELISEWQMTTGASGKKFRPVNVRKALKKIPKYSEEDRAQVYGLYSGQAAHPNYGGFQLISQDQLFRNGPFFNSNYNRALLADLAKFLCYSAYGMSKALNKSFNFPKLLKYVVAMQTDFHIKNEH